MQFPVIQELLESMAIPVVKVPGWEGDDILGTIAARDEALGYETLLVTGDKDAYQLAERADAHRDHEEGHHGRDHQRAGRGGGALRRDARPVHRLPGT